MPLLLMPRRELRSERDAICPKSHTPDHKGTSKGSSYSLQLGPLCSPALDAEPASVLKASGKGSQLPR